MATLAIRMASLTVKRSFSHGARMVKSATSTVNADQRPIVPQSAMEAQEQSNKTLVSVSATMLSPQPKYAMQTVSRTRW